MYDIPFIRFFMPCLVLYLFYYFLIENPMDLTDKSSQIPPEEAQLMRRQGLQLMDQKKWDQALTPIYKLHQAQPDSHVYHAHLGEIYHGLGRYADEVKMWELYLQHSPVPAEGCPQISEAYRALGKMDEVLKASKRCYDFEPTNSDMIFFYAHELERRGGRLAEAKALYEKGHTLSPNYPDISIGLARTRSAMGQNAAARKLIDEVLARRPNNTDALIAAGLIYWREGMRAQAIAHLQHAVQVSPDYREARQLLQEFSGKP